MGEIAGLERLLARFQHLWMVGQTEIVIGAQHNPSAPLDRHLRVLGVRDLAEVRVEPLGLKLARQGELAALVEQRQSVPVGRHLGE